MSETNVGNRREAEEGQTSVKMRMRSQSAGERAVTKWRKMSNRKL